MSEGDSEEEYTPKKSKPIKTRKLPPKKKKGSESDSDEDWGKKKTGGAKKGAAAGGGGGVSFRLSIILVCNGNVIDIAFPLRFVYGCL